MATGLEIFDEQLRAAGVPWPEVKKKKVPYKEDGIYRLGLFVDDHYNILFEYANKIMKATIFAYDFSELIDSEWFIPRTLFSAKNGFNEKSFYTEYNYEKSEYINQCNQKEIIKQIKSYNQKKLQERNITYKYIPDIIKNIIDHTINSLKPVPDDTKIKCLIALGACLDTPKEDMNEWNFQYTRSH